MKEIIRICITIAELFSQTTLSATKHKNMWPRFVHNWSCRFDNSVEECWPVGRSVHIGIVLYKIPIISLSRKDRKRPLHSSKP